MAISDKLSRVLAPPTRQVVNTSPYRVRIIGKLGTRTIGNILRSPCPQNDMINMAPKGSAMYVMERLKQLILLG